ncbi:hypothetical protein D3C76_1388290 [compost metagenome]
MLLEFVRIDAAYTVLVLAVDTVLGAFLLVAFQGHRVQLATFLAFAEVAFFDIGIADGPGPAFAFCRSRYRKQFDDVVVAHFFLGKTAEFLV